MACARRARGGPGFPYDVLVLGAGAAGILAAWRAASLGTRTLLLEKNRKPGAKILASGGGRCNVTTTLEGPSLLGAFRPPQRPFLRFAFKAFPPRKLRALLLQQGVPTHVEARSKVFPDVGRASAVLAGLLALLQEAEVLLLNERPVTEIKAPEQTGAPFAVRAGGELFLARAVVLAVGGRSYSRTGTTGDGYTLARALGHRVTPTCPALVGLEVPRAAFAGLAGLSLKEGRLSLLAGERVVASEEGPLLFTHHGLSGPAPMNLSGEVAARGGATLRLDLCPRQEFLELEQQLLLMGRTMPHRSVGRALKEKLPGRLVERCLAAAGVDPARPLGHLPRQQRRRLLHHLKGWPCEATGTRGFERAEVTRGGVALEEVAPRTMQSKKVAGLFLAGEVLDLDGPIGGFNFQAAFATGFLAGERAATQLQG